MLNKIFLITFKCLFCNLYTYKLLSLDFVRCNLNYFYYLLPELRDELLEEELRLLELDELRELPLLLRVDELDERTLDERLLDDERFTLLELLVVEDELLRLTLEELLLLDVDIDDERFDDDDVVFDTLPSFDDDFEVGRLYCSERVFSTEEGFV